MAKWQTEKQLKDLTVSLVEYASVTGTDEEIGIMSYIEHELSQLNYFQSNKEHLKCHATNDGRKFVTALVKSRESTDKTVILMGHLDVVDTEGYGEWKHLAFRPNELTSRFLERKHMLPEEVKKDLEKDDWLFGRGTMDMKAGIALCMSMVELAAEGHFDGNILFLGVPDEEVNSSGMRAAAPVLLETAESYGLDYILCWNTEPVFSMYPGDDNLYLYQGSVGKMLPGFYCYGKEAHVAEPFSGMSGNLMSSVITELIELNPDYSDGSGNEATPPPSTLIQKDLKLDYSVQIPHTAVSVFNLLTMEKSTEQITEELLKAANDAAEKIIELYKAREETFSRKLNYTPAVRQIKVLTYRELYDYAVSQNGKENVDSIVSYIEANEQPLDDREKTIQIVNETASLCKELAPMIVLFYAPPLYPSVSSYEDPFIQGLTSEFIRIAEREADMPLKAVRYFPGLSDLSYTSLNCPPAAFNSLTENMPIWGRGYTLPFSAMEKLDMPVINLGPVGKDPHSWTERVNITKSFRKFPHVMRKGLSHIFHKTVFQKSLD